MKAYRVMWLLNHTTLRKFEIAQFRAIGISEVYTPKTFPYDEGNLSANVDFSLDDNLRIPKDQLDILNAQDWYGSPSAEAWEIANQYFDVAFVAFFPEQLKSAVRNFKGAIVLRVFGHGRDHTYSRLVYQFAGERLVRDIRALGRRFWFGAGYEHLHQIESNFLPLRQCFLPVGLSATDTSSEWTGANARIFFVCPRIGSSSHFEKVYRDFRHTFGEMPYTIGGAQPVDVSDPNVIGFVSREQHERNMREHRVMFYHSQEPNHIHYHPFEAVAAGMPLVFMCGGLLDRLGGRNLPGRCLTIDEAKKKVRRILDGDQRLIHSIRTTQHVLLDAIKAENCAPVWQSEFSRVLDELERLRARPLPQARRSVRVAVVVPVAPKGARLRDAKLLAEAIRHGSEQAAEAADVVLAYFEEKTRPSISDHNFADLHPSIKRRTFSWKSLDARESRRAMRYAGHDDWEPAYDRYAVIDDGIRQLEDCDLWLIFSDCHSDPILPLRTVVHMVYDYGQQYVPTRNYDAERGFVRDTRAAECVFVTTNSAHQDALQYIGLRKTKVVKLPQLIANPGIDGQVLPESSNDYFVWTVGSAVEQSLANVVQALEIYYLELQGSLRCKVIGLDEDELWAQPLTRLEGAIGARDSRSEIRTRLTCLGSMTDADYRRLLSRAAFLWLSDYSDTNACHVVEAARLGVPSLSSDCSSMREVETQLLSCVTWMDISNANSMALALKDMEINQQARRTLLPPLETWTSLGVHQASREYWRAIRECL